MPRPRKTRREQRRSSFRLSPHHARYLRVLEASMPFISRGVAPLVLSILVAASGIGCVDISAGESAYVDTVEKRFTVTGTPTLNLGTFDGSVEVETWNRPEVLVIIEKHAFDKEAADRMQVRAEQAGDVITVEVKEERDGRMHMHFGSHGARLIVTVPKKAQIDAKTGDGRVTVRDVEIGRASCRERVCYPV